MATLLTGQPSQAAMDLVNLGTRRTRQGVAGLLGRNPNQFLTNQERAQDQLQDLMNRPADLSSVEGYTNFLKLQLQANPQNQAAILQAGLPQLQSLQQAKNKQMQEAQIRKTLTDQATSLELDDVVGRLNSGGDLESARSIIVETQKEKAVKVGGRAGLTAVANSISASNGIIKMIEDGGADEFIGKPKEFLEFIRGDKAQIKFFTDNRDQITINGKKEPNPHFGKSVPRRVDEFGRIYDAANDKWANPSETKLSESPNIVKNVTEGSALSEVSEALQEKFLESNYAAYDLDKDFAENTRQQALLNEGIFVGFGSETELLAARALEFLGVSSESLDEQVTRTQSFLVARAERVLEILGTGAVGAGTGISDRDVEFMKEAAAAKITLSEEFLREFLERERSILIAKRKLANKDLDRWLNTLPEEGRTKVDAAFRLPIPDAQSPVETSRPFAITNVQEGVSPAE
jgi:hypothetical protein